MAEPRLGETPGKVRHVFGTARFYPKPSLGKLIVRKPGVDRRSMKVIAINKKLRALKGTAKVPSKVCHEKYIKEHPGAKHAPISWMRECMSAEMKKIVGGGAE